MLLDADTGERWPFWAELDASDPAGVDRPLIVRPAKNFVEGHRYRGRPAQPGRRRRRGHRAVELFRAYRDDRPTFSPPIERRRAHIDDLFGTLEDHGVDRDDLFLAWDFTVASERNLSERMLHIRDDAFASLGAPRRSSPSRRSRTTSTSASPAG